MRVVRLAAVVTSIAVRAWAAPPSPPIELMRVIDSPEHRADLLRAGQDAMARLPDPCPDAEWRAIGDVGMFAPLVFDSTGRPVGGEWREQLTARGCGMARQFNVLTVVAADGSTATEPLLPGSTIANPVLQGDSTAFAAAAFGKLPDGCDRGSIVDTVFDGYDDESKPAARARPWHETWTLAACGKTAKVTMHFRPDSTGTDIKADPANESAP